MPRPPVLTGLALLSALVLGAAAPAAQQALDVSGTTVGAPTANLPEFGSAPAACTLAPAPEPYDPTPFTVDTDGPYDVSVVEPVSSGPGLDDTVLLVYEGAFDPADACANFVGVGNETAGSGLAVTLDDAPEYVLVVAGFFGTEDDYTVRIAGPPGSTVTDRTDPPATVTGVDLLVDTAADDQPYDAATSLAACTDGLLDGDCTLREAILVANAEPALDVIGFEVTPDNGASADGLVTIRVQSELPFLADDGITIDGYTQTPDGGTTTASPNTLTVGTDAVLLVEIDGTNAGDGKSGLPISEPNVTVRGLVINRFDSHGVVLFGSASNVVVEGCYIGTNVAGDAALPNGGVGILNFGGAGLRVGTDGDGVGDPGERNVLSGNAFHGVGVAGDPGTTGLVVAGNYVGTDATGTAAVPNGVFGVNIENAPGVQIGTDSDGQADDAERNVISGNGRDGVRVFGAGATGALVAGNYIGTDATGAAALGNGIDGVVVRGGSTDNTIGGAGAGAGNTIGFNGASGVFIADAGTTGNAVLGNHIGTNAAGADLGHGQNGVAIGPGASGNTIGGAGAGEGNTIGLNGTSGVWLFGTGTTGNAVLGNFIGTNAAGADLGNSTFGVYLSAAASDNTVGGSADGAGNTIGLNAYSGVFLVDAGTTGNAVLGNRIGTDAAGADLGNSGAGVYLGSGASDNTVGGVAEGEGNAIAFNGSGGVLLADAATGGNAVLGNAISGNDALGIDLGGGLAGGDGVTANDADDPDGGPNGLQNFPVLTAGQVSSAQIPTAASVTYTLDSTPSTSFLVEVFANDAADPSGFGEGARFVGSIVLTTDASGDAFYAGQTFGGVAYGEFLTATATPLDPAGPTGFGGTSEFSAAVEVLPATVFAEAAYTGVEGTSVEVAVGLLAPAQGGETVDLVLVSSAPAGATAADLDGFTSATVTFGPGDTEATVTIDVVDDGLAEDAEAFTLALRNPTGLAVRNPTETVLTVDPSAVGARFDVVQRVVREDVGAVELVVELTDAPPSDATLAVTLVSGDPADLGGFERATLAVSSAPGAPTRYTVSVPVTADAAPEPDESFVFRLTVEAGADPDYGSPGVVVGGPSLTALVVVDDDGERVTVTVPPRDADGDGAEDGGPRLFAFPVGGLTAADVAGVAGADSVYVVSPDGALVARGRTRSAGPSGRRRRRAPGADLPFAGSAPPSPGRLRRHRRGDGPRGRPGREPDGRGRSPWRRLSVEGGTLADVALVFDAVVRRVPSRLARGPRRAATPPPRTSTRSRAVILQVIPDGDAGRRDASRSATGDPDGRRRRRSPTPRSRRPTARRPSASRSDRPARDGATAHAWPPGPRRHVRPPVRRRRRGPRPVRRARRGRPARGHARRVGWTGDDTDGSLFAALSGSAPGPARRRSRSSCPCPRPGRMRSRWRGRRRRRRPAGRRRRSSTGRPRRSSPPASRSCSRWPGATTSGAGSPSGSRSGPAWPPRRGRRRRRWRCTRTRRRAG